MNRPRLWPAYLIAALLLGVLARIWLVGEEVRGRQYRVLPTIGVLLLSSLLLVVWWAFFSRLSRRLRLTGLAVAAVAAGTAVLLFRVRGVTGDWVPIVTLRWESSETIHVAAAPAPAAAPPSAPSPRSEPAASAAPVVPEPLSSRAAPTSAPARLPGDYPQFLGPTRDGALRGVRLARDWAATPPRRLWRQRVGEGWSGFAVRGDVAVTQEQRGSQERIVGYDLATGRELWSHADGARYETFIAGIGPRATPTIAAGRVFAMGGTGILNALDLASGRRLWSRNVVDDNGAALPEWGKSCSPLVVGTLVIVSAGGAGGRSLVAYDAASGEPVWTGGDDRSSYSSPLLFELAGRPQVVMFNAGSVAGHDPDTGGVLWQHAWPSQSPNVSTPVALGADRLLVSSGYGVGSKAFRIEGDAGGALEARLEWASPRLKSKFANVVVHGGWVYGLDDGVLTCIDPASGERQWKGGRYGHGQLLLVEDLLLVQTEEGEIVLLEPSPEGQRELTRFAVLDGKSWNPPALAGALLVVRNDREAAVYELPTLD
jgi:outer membrane protein assembly factor BamB